MKAHLSSLAQVLAAQRNAFQPVTKRQKAAEQRAAKTTAPHPEPLGNPVQP